MDIAAIAKAQSLGILLDAIGKPATVGGQTAGIAQPPSLGLATGESISATVTAVRPDGTLLIALKGQSVNAEIQGADLPAAARTPGAVLALRVETAGPNPRLAFVSAEPASAQPALPSSPGAAGLQQASQTQPAIATARLVAPGPAPTTPALPQPIAPTVDPRTAAVSRAASEAAVRQGSAAPLYADLAALVSRTGPALPPAVASLAQAILAGRLDGETPVTPAALRQAIESTGVLREAQVASGQPAPLDAKALLTTLRELLRSDAQRFSSPPNQDSEPPRRDGNVTAHRAVTAALVSETDPQTISTTLAREADQAVERLKLHQIASLPEQRATTADSAKPQQLSFELPIAFGQQTAMAGFRIEREKRRSKDSQQAVDIWGVRFAIDADVLGPVHAHVRLAGQRISVSLWAEDATTHSAFVAAIPMLEAALTGNALEIGDLAVFPGRPAEQKRAAAGHFLDRRS